MSRKKARALTGLSALLGVGVLVAGCAGGAAEGGADGRDVTIVTAVEPSGVEPCNAENGAAVVLRYNVIQSLTDLDPDSREVEPLLATSWEQKDDTTWVFQLREGVTFHDGEPFDAEAAVFGINRSLNNETLACSNTAKIGAGIKVTPEATGPYELTVTTNVPDPILPLELTYVDMVSPLTPMDEETDKPIGTGPFVWTAWNRGTSIVVDRWDDYWGEAPEVEHAEVIFRQEDSVRANVIKTGEADIGMDIADQDAPEGDRTKVYPLDATFSYRLPVQSEPFSDSRVREAFEIAIDREKVVPAILGRSGAPGWQLVPETNNGFASDFPMPAFDPTRAEELLADAAADGIDVSREVDMVAFNGQFPGSDELQQAVQQNLAAVGFNIKLRIVDSQEWVDLLFKPFPPEQKPTVLAVKHDNSSGDASSSYASYFSLEGCCGASTDTKLDSLLQTAFATGGEERESAFQKAASYAYTKDKTIIGVANLQGIVLLSDRVEYEPNALTDRNKFPLEDISFTE